MARSSSASATRNRRAPARSRQARREYASNLARLFLFAKPRMVLCQGMTQDFLHDLFGVKKGLGDLTRGPAVFFVVPVDDLECPGCLLGRRESKHPFAVGEERKAVGVLLGFITVHDPVRRVPDGDGGEGFAARVKYVRPALQADRGPDVNP